MSEKVSEVQRKKPGRNFGKTYSLRATPEQETFIETYREHDVSPSEVLSRALTRYMEYCQGVRQNEVRHGLCERHGAKR